MGWMHVNGVPNPFTILLEHPLAACVTSRSRKQEIPAGSGLGFSYLEGELGGCSLG